MYFLNLGVKGLKVLLSLFSKASGICANLVESCEALSLCSILTTLCWEEGRGRGRDFGPKEPFFYKKRMMVEKCHSAGVPTYSFDHDCSTLCIQEWHIRQLFQLF